MCAKHIGLLAEVLQLALLIATTIVRVFFKIVSSSVSYKEGTQCWRIVLRIFKDSRRIFNPEYLMQKTEI